MVGGYFQAPALSQNIFEIEKKEISGRNIGILVLKNARISLSMYGKWCKIEY